MKITAVYYCEDSSPYKMYVLDICEINNQFAFDNTFKKTLWELFEDEIEENSYPKPSSDVVFLYTDDFGASNIVTQMMNQDDCA
jgi:hypothetical protein